MYIIYYRICIFKRMVKIYKLDKFVIILLPVLSNTYRVYIYAQYSISRIIFYPTILPVNTNTYILFCMRCIIFFTSLLMATIKFCYCYFYLDLL